MSKSKNRPKNTTQEKARKISSPLIILGGLVLIAILGMTGINLLTGEAATHQPETVAQRIADEVSVDEAAVMRDAGAFVLDVRTPEEWNEFHIMGATLIPLNELESRLNEVPQDQEVVVVCRSGNRSAVGRDILRQAGFDQVTSMAGGMIDWRSAGLPTVSGP